MRTDSTYFQLINNYNKLQFYPLQYSLGVMRFASFGAPEIIGHSGSTGTAGFFCQEYKVSIAGAINLQDSSKCIKQLCKLLNCLVCERK